MSLRLNLLRSISTLGIVGILSQAMIAQVPQGKDCEAAELLPQTIMMCAEASNVHAALQTVLHHPLRTRIEALPAFVAAEKEGKLKQLQIGIKTFEGTMELPWEEAIKIISDRGITLALDSVEGGAALLMHSSDANVLERFYNFILSVQLLQGKASKQGEYRSVVAHSLNDNLKMVRLNDWLLLTNKSALGKTIIDQYLDRTENSLAKNDRFATAWKLAKSQPSESRVVTGYIDIDRTRSAGIAKELYNERADNLLAEVLLGGLLANLRHTPFATLAIDLSRSQITFNVKVPHDREWESPREYFFGEPTLAAAPPMLKVKDSLFALSAHRDLSQMWLRAGDLVSDKANDQLTVADTQLTTFFSGRDFGEDILGALHSDLQIVGKQQDFEGVLPQPAIKLPSFAMQFQMKNPDDTQPELRRVFQSFVGFINVTSSMNGQPQLDLGMEKMESAQLVTATFLPKRDQRESREAQIQFNFSPTLAFVDDRVILSSSTQLARELVSKNETVADAIDSGEQERTTNTVAALNAKTLRKILQENRTHLVSNNMLEKGHSRETAEAETDLLLEMIGYLQSARLALGVNDSTMQLSAAIVVDSSEESNDE